MPKILLRGLTTRVEVRNVARARTLTALRGLDPDRKGFLLRFLYEAGPISVENPIIDLSDASLNGANLNGSADLSRAYLSGAIVTTEQLDQAQSLKGAIMPDGSKHP